MLKTVSNISNYVINNNVTWTAPPKRVTVTDFTNPLFPRQIVISPNGVQVTRPDNGVGIAIPDLMAVVVAVNPAMTWPPLLTTQPSNQSAVHGSTSATFTVVANSELAATYQWQSSADNVSWSNVTNGGVYSGATTASLVVTPTDFTQDGLFYRCQVTNSQGTTASVSAKLTVTGTPVFTVQPSSHSIVHPAATSFTITAVADPAITALQWQLSTDGGTTWNNLTNVGVYSGVTTNTLAISDSTGLNSNQYRCMATNSAGTTNSNAATLTVT